MQEIRGIAMGYTIIDNGLSLVLRLSIAACCLVVLSVFLEKTLESYKSSRVTLNHWA